MHEVNCLLAFAQLAIDSLSVLQPNCYNGVHEAVMHYPAAQLQVLWLCQQLLCSR